MASQFSVDADRPLGLTRSVLRVKLLNRGLSPELAWSYIASFTFPQMVSLIANDKLVDYFSILAKDYVNRIAGLYEATFQVCMDSEENVARHRELYDAAQSCFAAGSECPVEWVWAAFVESEAHPE